MILRGAPYGYGRFLTEFKGHVKIGHTGTGGGFNSMLFTYPADQYTIVVLSNVDGTSVPVAVEVEYGIADLLLGGA